MFGEGKKSKKAEKIIKFIDLKELVLINKEKVKYLSKKIAEGGEGGINGIGEVSKKITIFKEGKEVKLIKLKELDILVRNAFRFKL